MKRHIQIKNSYDVWKPTTMQSLIGAECDSYYWVEIKNFKSLVVEWWLHNIGYWITKPFNRIPKIKSLNLRCKDVDLMVDILEEGTNGKEEN